MRQLVTTHSLELESFDHLSASDDGFRPYELVRVEIPCPELNRFLYASVGADWFWYTRLTWSHRQWLDWLDREEVGTWIAYVDGTPAGYFELERQPPGSVEIAYFGLLPQFIGRGLGRRLLVDAILTARDFGGQRVWLHTCSLDHPSALSNYQARGFRVVYGRASVYQERNVHDLVRDHSFVPPSP